MRHVLASAFLAFAVLACSNSGFRTNNSKDANNSQAPINSPSTSVSTGVSASANVNSSKIDVGSSSQNLTEASCQLRDPKDGVVTIANQADLQAMKPNTYYRLSGNIQLSGEFQPISKKVGDSSQIYLYILDGGGFEIRGLHVNQKLDEAAGLYGHVDCVHIFNLKVPDAEISGTIAVGALVGQAGMASIGPNVRVSGNVIGEEGVHGGAKVGGLVGAVYGSSTSRLGSFFKQSSFTGKVKSSYGGATSVAGGLLGMGGLVDVTESKTDATVSSSSISSGLIGTVSIANVSNSYTTGNISGGATAGLIQLTGREGQVVNSYSYGNLKNNDLLFRGLIECRDEMHPVSSSYFNADANPNVILKNGTAISAAQLMNPATFIGWDLGKIWIPVPGAPPKLRWE